MDRLLESLHYFDGSDDATLLEIRVWRATMFSLMEAHSTYNEQLLEAMKIMKHFLAEDDLQKNTGYCSQIAMNRMLDLVTRMASLHTQVWDGFCDTNGPYMKLMVWEDDFYDQLKKKSLEHWGDYLALEKTTDTHKKWYQKHLEKWIPLHDKMGKTMKPSDMSFDERFASLTGKVDVALTKYQSYFRKEAKYRQVLAEETDKIKRDFVKHEKARLDSLFDTLSLLFTATEKIVPKGTEGLEEFEFSPGENDTEELAAQGWESHLKSYTFQTYEGPPGTDPTQPSQPILAHGDLNKKKTPPHLCTVVSRENFLTADDVGTQPRSKSQDFKPEISNPRHLLRKLSSTNPASVQVDDEDEGNGLDSIDLAGPNLMPQDLVDNISMSDSLKNCSLVSEEELVNPKKKIKIAERVMSGSKSPDNSYGGKDTSLHFDDGGYDVLHKFWDPHDQHSTKTENIQSERDSILNTKKQESSVPKSVGAKSNETSQRQKPQNNSTKSIKTTTTDDKQKTLPANPISAMSDARSRRRMKENCPNDTTGNKKKDIDRWKSPDQPVEPNRSCQPQEESFPIKSQTSHITDSQDQPSTSQDQPTPRDGSEEKKDIDKKASIFSGSSVEEIKLCDSFRTTGQRKSTKTPIKGYILRKRAVTKKAAIESQTVPEGSKDKPVSVIVLKDRPKQSSCEISIRAGMKIKQIRGADKNGMAYGYKITKYGMKKWGLYPAELVTLYSTRSNSTETVNKDVS